MTDHTELRKKYVYLKSLSIGDMSPNEAAIASLLKENADMREALEGARKFIKDEYSCAKSSALEGHPIYDNPTPEGVPFAWVDADEDRREIVDRHNAALAQAAKDATERERERWQKREAALVWGLRRVRGWREIDRNTIREVLTEIENLAEDALAERGEFANPPAIREGSEP